MYKIMIAVSLTLLLSLGVNAQSKAKPDVSYLLIVPRYDKEVEEQVRKDYLLRWEKIYYFCVKNKYVMITADKYEYLKNEWTEISVKLKEILLRKP